MRKIISDEFAGPKIESYILFMYAIQNGPNWWIDLVARFPVGQIEDRGRIGAMGETMNRNPLDIDESSNTSKWTISSDTDQENTDHWHESLNQALKDDMMQNSASTLAATSPSEDRQGLFALMSA